MAIDRHTSPRLMSVPERIIIRILMCFAICVMLVSLFGLYLELFTETHLGNVIARLNIIH